MKVSALVYTDDHRRKAEFDATPWFERASDEELAELARIEWGGDYQADYVAQFFDGKDGNVSHVFEYLSDSPRMPFSDDPVGFECHVDADEALAWLSVNRPGIIPEA